MLIRNAFAGRTEGVPWLRYFPAAKHLAERRWPSVSHVVGAFAMAGFTVETIQRIPQTTDPDLKSYARRIRVRADSTLAALDDREFHRGMEALERAAKRARGPHPVVTTLDLLILS